MQAQAASSEGSDTPTGVGGFGEYLEGMGWGVFGGYLRGIWRVFGEYLEEVWGVFGGYLEGVWGVT